MPTKNIYISEELKSKMDEAPHLNWSQVFAAAVENALLHQAQNLPEVMFAWKTAGKKRRGSAGLGSLGQGNAG